MTDESLRDDEPKISQISNGATRRAQQRKTLVTPAPGRDGKRPGSTEDEQLLNRATPPTPRPKAPELGAFTHTDPWRIMRIQAEFVHGINALAEIGAAVAVFGSARVKPEHPAYVAARELGAKLAAAGFAVITGGG